jgi:hypothetical protein
VSRKRKVDEISASCSVYACSTWPDYCYSIQIYGSPSIISIAFMALLRWNRKYVRGIGGKRLFEGNGRDTRWIVSDFVRAMNEANRVKLAWVSGWVGPGKLTRFEIQYSWYIEVWILNSHCHWSLLCFKIQNSISSSNGALNLKPGGGVHSGSKFNIMIWGLNFEWAFCLLVYRTNARKHQLVISLLYCPLGVSVR